MLETQAMKLFEKQSPVAVCVRGVLENALSAKRLDEIFEEAAQKQYCRELAFSTVVDLMGKVVTRVHPSIHASYKAQKDTIGVSAMSVYNKLKGIEPVVCERLVHATARDLACVIDELGHHGQSPVPGYQVRIFDGNHLAGTDHRIKELRPLGAAALPGQTIPILDPQRKLIEDVIVCEDGHANERTMIPQIVERVQPGQCWIADANFCTLNMLFDISERRGKFIVRQHGNLHGELIGRRRRCDRCDTGVVYEQTLRITQRSDNKIVRQMDVRRITIKRDKPTKKGQTEVHVLSSLPKSVSAKKIAKAYRQRWCIETAFQEITTTLRCEINTLGYPDAALFAFCVALMHYNVLSVVQAALLSSHNADPKKTKLSLYALAHEVSGVWRGMQIVVADELWTDNYAHLTPKQLARQLRRVAGNADLSRLTPHRWSPKRPQPKRVSGNRGNHVSTQEVLNKRKTRARKTRAKAP